jgi:hypothetical protein
MSRSCIYLRRVLFGVSCAVVFGFGATQAFAMPDPPPSGSCVAGGHPYIPVNECPECGEPGSGYCDGSSTDCVCW